MSASPALILDNLIWYALQTGDQLNASGGAYAKIIRRDMGAFAGLVADQVKSWQELYELIPVNETAVLFAANRLNVPSNWRIALERALDQMIYAGDRLVIKAPVSLRPLDEPDIPAMRALTELTKPGPFLKRTIDFGNYKGIFEDGRLVSMTGQRFKPDPYTEISAVCTHPNAVGKGYAGKLLASQVNHILAAGRTPILHVYPDNLPAIHVYRKHGFQLRASMFVYVVVKEN